MNYIPGKRSILNDKRTHPKVYCTVLNKFLNKIKITSVLPILISGETTADMVKKANFFNEFFAS